MSDAKRPPYREPAAASTSRPRGTVVSRPDDDAPEAAPRAVARVPAVDPEAGVFSGLVSPVAGSTSSEWWAQAALTFVGLPLLVATFLLVGWLDTRLAYERAKRGASARPMGIAHPAAWIFGALALVAIGLATRVPLPAIAIGIAIPFAALFARRVMSRRILEREVVLARMRQRKR